MKIWWPWRRNKPALSLFEGALCYSGSNREILKRIS
jgi:hypothetical protein